jgi:hypothetical protein
MADVERLVDAGGRIVAQGPLEKSVGTRRMYYPSLV